MHLGINALRRGLVALAISLAAAVLASTPSAVFAQSAGGIAPGQLQALGAYKAAHDTDPHVGDNTSSATISSTRGGLRSSGASASLASTFPVNYLIGQDQQGQQRTYWCGPAAASEALGLWGYSYSQTYMASVMGTTTNGTAWSGVNASVPSAYLTGHPMRDAVDYLMAVRSGGDPGYVVTSVPYTPTQTDTNNYISHLQLDVWAGYPIMADAWEVAGYPHLVGHPGNLTIFHWFTIIGYRTNGTYTSYEDSATSVWSTVPAYTMSFSSSELVGIIGGRGYIW